MKKEKTAVSTEKNDKLIERKGVRIAKVILNTVINVMIVLVLLISVLVAVLALSSKQNDGMANLFGYTFQTIESNSMKGGSPDGYEGGDYEKGDLVLGKPVSIDEDREYNVGDIVTFKTVNENDEEMFKAHRIVRKVKTEAGYYVYQTWGDNRDDSKKDNPDAAALPDQMDEKDYLMSMDIKTVLYADDYHGKVIKGIGGWLSSLRTSTGFFLWILLPMIIFFLYEIVRVVLNAINYKKSKAAEEVENAERAKQEAIDAAVKAALEAKGETADNVPADAAGSDDELTPEQIKQFKQFLALQKAQETASAEAPAEPESEELTEASAEAAEEPAEKPAEEE